MADGYDGSIRINTKIDSSSFNAGMSNVSASVKRFMTGLLISSVKVAIVLGAVVTAVAALATALIGVGIAAALLGIRLIHAMSQAVNRTNDLGRQIAEIEVLFADVQGAIYAAFSPLVAFALPYIKMIVAWLVNMLNTIAMIVAAMLGQSTVMQYIAGSADTAANNTGRLASNTKKAEKAAKGALAAFDQLNVLQMQTADNAGAGGGGGAGGGAFQFKKVPVSQEAIDFVDKWKKKWEDLKKSVIDTWEAVWGWEFDADQWFIDSVWTPLINAISDKNGKIDWTAIFTPFIGSGLYLSFLLLANKVNDLQTIFYNIGVGMAATWLLIQVMWKLAPFWFSAHVTEPLKNGFALALDWIKNKWETVFTGIKAFVKNTVNSMIDFINAMIAAVAGGLNSIIGNINKIKFTVPAWIPGFGGKSWNVSIPRVSGVTIPKLATGAVIPPNAAFAAILGDQKSGRNIEAPEGLIRQIIQEEIGKMQADITINFAGSLGPLVRELKPFIDRENVRVGGNLISGGSVA